MKTVALVLKHKVALDVCVDWVTLEKRAQVRSVIHIFLIGLVKPRLGLF